MSKQIVREIKDVKSVDNKKIKFTQSVVVSEEKTREATIKELLSDKASLENAIQATLISRNSAYQRSNETIETLNDQLDKVNQIIEQARAMGLKE